MASSSRQIKHKKKMAARRAEKAQRKAKYEAMAGTSKKNKRQGKTTLVSSNGKHAHLMAMCGNVGCKKCFPKLNG